MIVDDEEGEAVNNKEDLDGGGEACAAVPPGRLAPLLTPDSLF